MTSDKFRWRRPLAIGLALIAAASVPVRPVAADGLPDLGDTAQADFSPQLERKVGEQLYLETRRRDPSYIDDPELADYLDRLGQRLSEHLPGERMDVRMFLLADPTLNAFAWPGGFVGVHTGLWLAANSESELAGVLAHELAHLSQRHIARLVQRQGQMSIANLLSMAVAVLASRASSQVSQAALIAGQAVTVQAQLNYTREFEREADRVGIQTLQDSGFDARGMGSFFGRLLRESRLYENNAPAYLRTHPLTTERIADVDNRLQNVPYRQVPDSTEFRLYQEKLRARLGTPADAVKDFQRRLQQAGTAAQGALRFGLSYALLRANDLRAAADELGRLRAAGLPVAPVEHLAGQIARARGDAFAAVRTYAAARVRAPGDRVLLYGHIEAELAAGQAESARRLAESALAERPRDERLSGYLAQAHGLLGQRAAQHAAQAESYAVQGMLSEAIEQLELAQRAGDGDFYRLSAIDARLRELRARRAEEKRDEGRRSRGG